MTSRRTISRRSPDWTSLREREAAKVEYRADAICLAWYLERQLFEAGWDASFDGEIIGVIASGIFVRFGVFEGYLPARHLPGEYFELNALGTALVGRKTGRRYRLGDPIAVRVEVIDRVEGKVELRPGGAGTRRPRTTFISLMRLEGIHHITCITGDAPRNVDFYARVLGLRMVKKTVNQDDPTVYHLFYADDKGSAGADLTFFEYPGVRPGRAGAGMVHRITWRVGSEAALDFWAERLGAEHVDVERDDSGSASRIRRGSGSSWRSSRRRTSRSSRFTRRFPPSSRCRASTPCGSTAPRRTPAGRSSPRA